ncbi:hypothetical protein Acr_04g0002020 [Actinidia rufa]|uniref:Retrovirus-related Pol polyprotein from transposon TNT 1-94-like beta-barrel domain-containing protein n=1 Tax=Actinidia rufa TaxID=165716 RepID=A0A7J0EG62_9ERIC|nr:hypothetical protein Acr_04g0002020 [Actinidia rufa]
MMAVDEDESDVLLAVSENGKSDWVLDSGSAYHLCRDREVFSTYAPCEGRVWMANNTASRVVDRGQSGSAWQTGDSKGCSFDASGGTLRVSKENKEMLWRKNIGGLYRLEGNVQTGGATVRHGSSGISKENGQGKQPLHRSTQSKHRVQDVHREAQRKETKSILKSYTAKGVATPKRVSFALDLISGGHLGEKVQALQYGGAYTSHNSDHPGLWRLRRLRPDLLMFGRKTPKMNIEEGSRSFLSWIEDRPDLQKLEVEMSWKDGDVTRVPC